MRHRVAGRHLGRSPAHRKALRRNLAIALFQHGAIRTTEAKAKDVKPFVEKLITLAKKNTIQARRMVSAELGNRHGKRGNDSRGKRQDTGRGRMFQVVDGFEVQELEQSLLERIFDDIAPRYADRPGGYTRLIRLSERRIGDAGKQVLLQLVEEGASAEESAAPSQSRRRSRAAKRHEAIDAINVDETSAEQETPAEEEAQAAADNQAEAPEAEGGDEETKSE